MKQELFRSELRRKDGRALPLDFVLYNLSIEDSPPVPGEEFNIDEHIFIQPDTIFLVCIPLHLNLLFSLIPFPYRR